ncbi:uncharacterized protein isoform X2 [Danio rerio]|uniref:Uncharacterized protein isoform X2 n=1 Tax=Danio rerio TaxID=7955 RepID=A0AC58G321_DANRE
MELISLPLILLLISNIDRGHTLEDLIEEPKAVLTVQPEPSWILGGGTVTLTCDVEGESRACIWQCGGKDITTMRKEINITVHFSQTCMCYCCIQSRTCCSQWSDEVNLTVVYPSNIKKQPEAAKSKLTNFKLVSFLLAASPYLLVSILLGVKCYRAHAQAEEIN